MSPRNGLLTIPALFLFVFSLASCSHKLGEDSKKNDNRVKIEPPTIDVGQIEQGNKVLQSFVISNLANQEITITGTNKSCGCTIVGTSKTHLLPGETAVLKVSIDTHNRVGLFSVWAGIKWKCKSSLEQGQSDVFISGDIVVYAICDPVPLNLGSVDSFSTNQKATFIVSHGEKTPEWSNIEAQSEGLSFAKRMLDSGNYAITVSFNPSTLPIGIFKRDIDLRLLSQSGTLLKHYELPFEVRVTDNISVSPPTVFMSVVPTNCKREGIITLNSSLRLHIFSLKSSDPKFLAADFKQITSTQVELEYAASSGTNEGNHSGTLIVELALGQRHKEVAIPFIAYVKDMTSNN